MCHKCPPRVIHSKRSGVNIPLRWLQIALHTLQQIFTIYIRSRLYIYVYMCFFLRGGNTSPLLPPLPPSSLPAPAHCRAPRGSSLGSVGESHLFSAPTPTYFPWCGSFAAPYCWGKLGDVRQEKRSFSYGEDGGETQEGVVK